jgi:hypothetical protein
MDALVAVLDLADERRRTLPDHVEQARRQFLVLIWLHGARSRCSD